MPEPTTPAGWLDAWGPTRASRPAVRTVDVHTHLMIPESAELARPHFRPELDPRTFYSSEETTALNQEYYRLARSKYTDPDTRLRDMDAMGIDVQLVAVAPNHYYYWADAKLADQLANLQNDRIAQFVAHAPDRMVGVGTIPLAHTAEAVREARRLSRELGFPAIQIGTDTAGRELDDPALDPLWEELASSGTVVILHPAGFTHGERLTDYYLVNVIGMPLSSTVAVTRMILGGVFERHPGLRMLVVHGGGYLSFYAARTDHAFRHRPELRRHIDRLPSEYLATLYFDVAVFDPVMVESLATRFGAGHVLLGTDYPFDMGVTDPLALIEDADLAEEDRAAIAGGSAAALFGIE